MFGHKNKSRYENRTYGQISLDRLEELNKMAFYDVCMETEVNIPEGEITYPEKATQFEYQVYYMFKRAVKDGMALERSILGES